MIQIEDMAGFLALEHPTDTSAPFFTAVFAPVGTPSLIPSSGVGTPPYVASVDPGVTQDDGWSILHPLSSAKTAAVTGVKYAALALLAVALIGIGAWALVSGPSSREG